MPSKTISSYRQAIQGTLSVPGDKSISHRALMFGALAQGKTTISGLLKSADVLSTWACLEQLGVSIYEEDGTVYVEGVDGQFIPSEKPLDCGNSGTTMRLIMGILAGQPFSSTLIGDASLQGRPMARVATPLSHMGAKISLTNGPYPPVHIQPAQLKACAYELPIASAQVKSALILAAHFAEGESHFTGELTSRDHTERLLPGFGAKLFCSRELISYRGQQRLKGTSLQVPGDSSSAAFWATLVSLIPGSKMVLLNVSLNPTRLGFFDVLKRMGTSIIIEPQVDSPEPLGTMTIEYSPLKGVKILPEEVPLLIDEIPLLGLLATQATGRTEVRGAEELRVKESDRLEAILSNLRVLGVEATEYEDGFEIEGPQELEGGHIKTYGDHRIAMTFSLAGLISKDPLVLDDADCVAISYPTFYETLDSLTPSL